MKLQACPPSRKRSGEAGGRSEADRARAGGFRGMLIIFIGVSSLG